MIITKEGNIALITHERASFETLLQGINAQYDSLKNFNIIIQLWSMEAIEPLALAVFLELSNMHRSNKQSFVLVSDQVSYDDVNEALLVVPTLQEAKDIIEMEEIERDLGF